MKSTFYSVALAVFLSAVAMPVLAHGGSPLQMLKQIKSQLQLNTSQEQQWDAVLAQEKAAHATARASFAQVQTALQTELAKPEPDLAAVATLSDGVRQQNEDAAQADTRRVARAVCELHARAKGSGARYDQGRPRSRWRHVGPRMVARRRVPTE